MYTYFTTNNLPVSHQDKMTERLISEEICQSVLKQSKADDVFM